MSHRPKLCHLLLAASLLLLPVPSGGQESEGFANLEMLPKDIDRGELMEVMKGFTRSLGVRCEHCHVGEAGKPLSTFDFAADNRPTKRTARVMMRLVRDLNRRLPADLGLESAVEVGCVTCHRGQNKPRLIDDILDQETERGGVAAAIVKYRQLREQYHGRGTFDFDERVLQRWATRRARDGEPEQSLAILGLAEELFPDSLRVKLLFGEAHLRSGDRAAAEARYRQVLALDPENRIARQRLAELSPEPAEP